MNRAIDVVANSRVAPAEIGTRSCFHECYYLLSEALIRTTDDDRVEDFGMAANYFFDLLHEHLLAVLITIESRPSSTMVPSAVTVARSPGMDTRCPSITGTVQFVCAGSSR
ncbi:MAG TPA: hypothetical protein VEP49_08645 [Acidimicrobiia bacterium]|nr:hypothetical protein [Acidimicrobiia bacterium]